MSEATPSTHDAGIALLRALVTELRSLAHDPATVHLIADKLHHSIDALEKVITEQPKDAEKK